MNIRRLIQIAAAAAVCLGATAFAGLSWAASDGGAVPRGSMLAATAKAKSHPGVICVRYDSDDTPQCLGHGPRGYRGHRGHIGTRGARGTVGPVGATGPIGATGPTGATGPQGIQGIQGIQGAAGTFSTDGSDPGGNVEEVLGTKVGPITITQAPETGTELTPSTARCRSAGVDREAYDGGAIITTSNPGVDVVGLEASFPGLYVGATEVDPLPLGAAPGKVSSMAANAYEAQAVITNVASGDQITVQAYVLCGP
ncbi:MAG: hypothetical protein ACREQM_19860 [Candidatus Dormibacteraceae bacterium]